MDFIRVGDKIISMERLNKAIMQILKLRAGGMSQNDVSNELGIDRSFISRLEGLGEVRKGGRLALVGFPVSNPDELKAVAEEEGCDFTFLMTNRERWNWVDKDSGVDLINEVMALISRVKEYDSIILIGSTMRIRLLETVIGRDVIPIPLGESPINEDRYVDPEEVRALIRTIRK